MFIQSLIQERWVYIRNQNESKSDFYPFLAKPVAKLGMSYANLKDH